MDLSALVNMIPAPWNVILFIALPIILHRLGVPVPFLPSPSKPVNPPPPAIPDNPVTPVTPAPLSIPNHPLLNALLGVLASLRSVGELTSEEKALAGAIGKSLIDVAVVPATVTTK